MASSASTVNNSSTVAPRGLKSFTMKLRAKLEKAKGRVNKKKASANTGEAIIEPNHSKEQIQIVIRGPIVMEPKRVADEGIATTIEPEAAKEEVLTITVDTEPLEDRDQVIAIQAKVAEEDGQVIAANPNHTNEQGQNITMNLKPAEESNQKVKNPGTHQKPSKEKKAEKRAARKEARKAKWSARRAAFKAKAHKIGEALFISVAVVCGIVFGPVILAFDVCLCAFKSVVWLVVKIVDCLTAPFVACFYFCR